MFQIVSKAQFWALKKIWNIYFFVQMDPKLIKNVVLLLSKKFQQT